MRRGSCRRRRCRFSGQDQSGYRAGDRNPSLGCRRCYRGRVGLVKFSDVIYLSHVEGGSQVRGVELLVKFAN